MNIETDINEFYQFDGKLKMVEKELRTINTDLADFLNKKGHKSRVYVINCNDTDFDFRTFESEGDEESIMQEAERLGSVYSLEGFQEALNDEELILDNSFILIK